MKRRIFSLLITLVVAVSVVIGVSLTANAADEPKDGIVNSSISVAENVTLIMEVAVAEPAEDAVATITLPDGTITTVPLAEAKMSSGNYLFFAEVAIKDVANDVTITIPRKDESNLEVTTTALAYCEQYLADTEQIEFNGLVEALKAYATAAAYYFDEVKNNAPAVTDEPDFLGVADAIKGGTLPAGIKHRSVTLFLESETTIRHYFELTDDSRFIENYTFFVDLDKDDKCDVNEKLTPQKKVNDNGTVVYYVEIQNLTPNMLDTVYRIGVTGKADGNTYTYDYGALTYAKRSYAKGDNDTKNLTAAIFNYNKAASGLKGTITFNNGSTVTEGEYEYGVAKPIAAPTKAGDVFLGWEDENGNVVTTIPANKTGDINLTAKWAGIRTNYDASKYSDVTRSYCNNHGADANNDEICDNCGYCVDNADCTLGNTSAKAACTKCGNERLGAAAFNDFAGMKASATDLGHGYAKKITDSSDKEVMMFGVFKTIMNLNYIVGRDNAGLASSAGKIFALTVEVGLPTEEQYSEVEVAPSKPLDDKDGAFYFRISGSTDDRVFFVSGGKAYISGDSSKSVTLPRGKVTKLTVVFDFTGAVAGDGDADRYTVALYDENGSLVNKANATLANGDISAYSKSYLFQFRTNSDGRFLLGDIDVISANPFVNYVINAEDSANLCNYTPGTATKLPTPTKDGYEFAGWFADEALTQPIDEVPANAIGTFKVYAKWNCYVVSQNFDSGSTAGFNVGKGASGTAPVKDGALVWAPTTNSSGGQTTIKNAGAAISDIEVKDSSVTWSFELAKDADLAVLPTKLRFTSSDGIEARLITVASNGKVTAGLSSTVLATLDTDLVAIDVVANFAEKTLCFYVDGLFVTKLTDVTFADLSLYTDAGKCLNIYPTAGNTADKALVFGKIEIIGGDIYA